MTPDSQMETSKLIRQTNQITNLVLETNLSQTKKAAYQALALYPGT